ncbi:MAG TPA: MiaB/RimO family radical SAM methylthiotransferase [Terracidiphilus sp.]|nr:MiaB/RimO family radical SAM methylthiotransferase [Terracidiphilus sp.]
MAGRVRSQSQSKRIFNRLERMGGFHVENFGCRAARADGEAIAGHLRAMAERRPLGSDVVVVNTCTVTAEADRAARAFIRRAHRRDPEAKIVVTGCYAQRAPQELAKMPGVVAVVGNSHKALAPGIIFDVAQDAPAAPAATLVPVASIMPAAESQTASIWADDAFAHSFLEDAHLASGAQTRPNLKIQEGCGNRCTFCVIPFTRGPSRSLPREAVLSQVEYFVAAGGKELVLSGINLGRYSSGFGLESLAALVRAIFGQTLLSRLRLSSIEPMDWDGELVDLMREFGGRRLARHAHLPLQSGSDAVLRRMHRRYRPWHYESKVAELISAAGSDVTLGADVMIGFPGETDREFEETLAFIASLPFGYLHLFPFSPRPGTPGWAMHQASPVPAAVVEERMTALRALAHEKMLAHRSSFIGRNLAAITLRTPEETALAGRTSVLSENFLPIDVDGRFPANELLDVRVTGVARDGSMSGVAIR